MNSKTEYDFTKAEPIEFDKIKPGMLITHHDGVDFYLGKAVEISEESDDLWVDKKGGYVADRECQNYLIPKKPKPLPTEGGARIRILSDHNIFPKGCTLTFNLFADRWFVDGYANQVKPGDLADIEWEAVKVVPVGA